jgi:hypothetical protein
MNTYTKLLANLDLLLHSSGIYGILIKVQVIESVVHFEQFDEEIKCLLG